MFLFKVLNCLGGFSAVSFILLGRFRCGRPLLNFLCFFNFSLCVEGRLARGHMHFRKLRCVTFNFDRHGSSSILDYYLRILLNSIFNLNMLILLCILNPELLNVHFFLTFFWYFSARDTHMDILQAILQHSFLVPIDERNTDRYIKFDAFVRLLVKQNKVVSAHI
jgi:hypothetical protein